MRILRASVTAGLVSFLMIACSSGGSGSKPAPCHTNADCGFGLGCEISSSDAYCSPMCSMDSNCTVQSNCKGQTDAPEQKCKTFMKGQDGNTGDTYSVCDLYNGSYGPNTCAAGFTNSSGSDGGSSEGGSSDGGSSDGGSSGSGSSDGGSPDSGGSSQGGGQNASSDSGTGGWADSSTCQTGAENVYECCALSGASCQTIDAYASCCENKSCSSGKTIACMALKASNSVDACNASLSACGT